MWNGQGGYAGGRGGSHTTPTGGDGESHSEASSNTGLGGGGGGAVGRVRFNGTTTMLVGIVSPEFATGLATTGRLLETTAPLFFITDGGVDGGEDGGEVDAGDADAGDADAGEADGGEVDAGAGDGGVQPPRAYAVGCGCAALDGGVGLLLLAVLALRRRRRV
ncbi:MAG: hypothetical protein AB1938_15285 [Myxococcota bacterium]